MDLESIYYDFVNWGLLAPSMSSLKEFMAEPTWLTVNIWNKTQKNKAETLQQQSIPTAKLTNCVVSALGGGKSKIDDFTLYSFNSLDNDTISLESILIYDQCIAKDLIPSYILGTFFRDSGIANAIKSKSKGRGK